MTATKRPLKVFLYHACADTLAGTGRDSVRARWLSSSGAAYRNHTRLTQDGVDAWLDKEKLILGQIGNWKSARQCGR
jgi:hypothetical protein